MSNGLIAWLDIEVRLLKAERPLEAAFIMVNESHALAAFRQAVLWSDQDGLVALSGAAVADDKTPYALWLGRLFRHLNAQETGLRQITSADVAPDIAEQWQEWLPLHGLLIPLKGETILFARDEPFSDMDVMLLQRMADLGSMVRQALKPHFRLSDVTRRVTGRKKIIAAVGVVAVCLFPVTGSVLAPAESVSANPLMVRAPLDGVIDKIHVKPNQNVQDGQALFDMDSTTLTGRLDVARQQMATAEAEYRQAAQAMVFDPKAKAQVAILAGKADEKAAEVKWLESQLQRISVKAPAAGIVVFDDVSEWVGKPVVVGEKVMILANEKDSEFEAWLPASDVGEAQIGAKLTMFLNTQPLSPIHAKVRSVAYDATARPDGSLAHRVRATIIDGEDKPRLGLKGTARIDGDRVPLIWWLFRRPLSVVRQTLGF